MTVNKGCATPSLFVEFETTLLIAAMPAKPVVNIFVKLGSFSKA